MIGHRRVLIHAFLLDTIRLFSFPHFVLYMRPFSFFLAFVMNHKCCSLTTRSFSTSNYVIFCTFVSTCDFGTFLFLSLYLLRKFVDLRKKGIANWEKSKERTERIVEKERERMSSALLLDDYVFEKMEKIGRGKKKKFPKLIPAFSLNKTITWIYKIMSLFPCFQPNSWLKHRHTYDAWYTRSIKSPHKQFSLGLIKFSEVFWFWFWVSYNPIIDICQQQG